MHISDISTLVFLFSNLELQIKGDGWDSTLSLPNHLGILEYYGTVLWIRNSLSVFAQTYVFSELGQKDTS